MEGVLCEDLGATETEKEEKNIPSIIQATMRIKVIEKMSAFSSVLQPFQGLYVETSNELDVQLL